jgi:type IV secretion system protein VirD4
MSRFGKDLDIGFLDEKGRTEEHCFIGRRLGDPLAYAGDVIVKVDAHQTTIGATRSGKTVGQVIPNLMWASGSAFVIDPKGEIAWAVVVFLRLLGKKVVIVDPFDEVNKRYGQRLSIFEKIACYNPLADLKPSDPLYTAELYDLVTGLIPCTNYRNKYFIDGAINLVVAIIDALIRSKIKAATLPEVMKIIHSGIEGIKSFAKSILNDQETYGSNSLAREILERYAGLNPAHEHKEDGLFISEARNTLKYLNDPLIQKSLSSSDFSFREFTDDNTELVVFIVLPPTLLEPYNGWLRMMLTMAISAVSSNCTSLRYPVNFILDEFGTVGTLPIVSRAYGLMGGRGIRLWIFIQNISQLKRDYPYDWQNFLGNSSAISVLKIFDLETAELVSNMLGQRMTEYRTGQRGYYYSNDSQVITSMRPLLTPDEILRLPDDIGILITDTYPVYFKKARCYADQPFCDVIRPNPLY